MVNRGNTAVAYGIQVLEMEKTNGYTKATHIYCKTHFTSAAIISAAKNIFEYDYHINNYTQIIVYKSYSCV
jgi:hypothetical protein